MRQGIRTTFSLEEVTLEFDPSAATLLCRRDGEKVWIHSLSHPCGIESVTEDAHRIYLSCQYDHHRGQFLALNRETGRTTWFIPGYAFLQVHYKKSLYLIFGEESEEGFYLIKVNPEDGAPEWDYHVHQDLAEYHFRDNTLHLQYHYNAPHRIDLRTGLPLKEMRTGA